MEDIEIIELFWQRSESAIEETAGKYGSYIFTVAMNILEDTGEAEESVNDTYLATWNAVPPTRPRIFSAFLAKLARRISISRWRRRTAVKRGGTGADAVYEELSEVLADGSDIDSAMEQKRLSALIEAFVKGLSADSRRAFILRYFHMYSIENISQRLSFSVSRVKSMLKRSRDRLAAMLIREDFL